MASVAARPLVALRTKVSNNNRPTKQLAARWELKDEFILINFVFVLRRVGGSDDFPTDIARLQFNFLSNRPQGHSKVE